MQKKKLFILYVLLALISACTASLPPVADHAQPPSKTTPLVLPAEKATSPPRESFFSRGTNKDEALFLQGLHQLLDPVATNAAGNAKDTLESLINSYPRSKWRDAAVAILHLIGEVDDYHRRLLM